MSFKIIFASTLQKRFHVNFSYVLNCYRSPLLSIFVLCGVNYGVAFDRFYKYVCDYVKIYAINHYFVLFIYFIYFIF